MHPDDDESTETNQCDMKLRDSFDPYDESPLNAFFERLCTLIMCGIAFAYVGRVGFDVLKWWLR